MIELRDPNSVRRVADWVELNVAVRRERVSKAQVASAIESLRGTEPSESFTSDVWRELEYRHDLYTNPTFEVSERTIEPQPNIEPSLEYLACLILSLFGVQETAHDPGKLFERITCKAVEQYLSGNAFVFGWPFEPEAAPAERESQLKQKIRRVAEALGERFVEAPPTQFNDRGVDVIGWIPFAEERSGQFVMLLQCTAQRNWKDKHAVPLDSWCQYIHWTCDPIKGFAVPSIVIPKDWHERSREKGILFDRARIINLLPTDTYDAALADELNTWVQEQLAELQP